MVKKLVSILGASIIGLGGIAASPSEDKRPYIKSIETYPSQENPVSVRIGVYFPTTNGVWKVEKSTNLVDWVEGVNTNVTVKYPRSLIFLYEPIEGDKGFYRIKSKD